MIAALYRQAYIIKQARATGATQLARKPRASFGRLWITASARTTLIAERRGSMSLHVHRARHLHKLKAPIGFCAVVFAMRCRRLSASIGAPVGDATTQHPCSRGPLAQPWIDPGLLRKFTAGLTRVRRCGGRIG